MIFDSHAHYDDEAFDIDREIVFDEIKKSNVKYVMDAGSDLKSSLKAVELAQKHDFVYAAVGIHPEHADELNGTTMDTLKSLATFDKVSAIGEIGLDYYYDGIKRDDQKKAFECQLNLALELKLPVIIHDREAHEDTFEMIKKYTRDGLRGVLHCYSGSIDIAREYVNMGFYLGFTGVITFKNAKKPLEVLNEIPKDRILIETDCPYLAPVPFRGKRNDSRNLEFVVKKACGVLNLDEEYFKELTCNNAKRLFNIR